MKTTRIQLVLVAITLVVGSFAAPVVGDEQTELRRAQLGAGRKSLAKQTKVNYQGSTSPLKLNDKPVFRYDDQPRRFIDATMWVWTDQGRPMAFQKIEAVEYGDLTSPKRPRRFCFRST